MSERLTKSVTPAGVCMTTLNSMKHYIPCVPCRHNAKVKTDANGKQYTEKFTFCDTCEVKMLFAKLKEYEDLEEQGLLLRIPVAVGDTVYYLAFGKVFSAEVFEVKYICEAEDYGKLFIRQRITIDGDECGITFIDFSDIGKKYFLTKSEAEEKLREL